jgi:hypothetical protein
MAHDEEEYIRNPKKRDPSEWIPAVVVIAAAAIGIFIMVWVNGSR